MSNEAKLALAKARYAVVSERGKSSEGLLRKLRRIIKKYS